MSTIFHYIFYQPVLNLMVVLYNNIPGHDIGLVIIVFTIIIKILLLPLTKKSIQSQKAMQDLQPKIEEVKKKYAGNKEELGKAMMELYKENKVNPFSSCLLLLVQLPFFIAIFQVFRLGLSNSSLSYVYSFVHNPVTINHMSLGLLDLSKPNAFLAVLAGAAQWWQAKMMTTKNPEVKTPESQDENMMAIMNKQMLYMMPIMTVFIGLTLPSGLALYWLVTTLLTGLQQVLVFKEKPVVAENK